jgi:hypothetical protein
MRLLQPDLGEIHARCLPAALDQPDRVASLAAREIDRASGRETLGLGNEEADRLGGPD